MATHSLTDTLTLPTAEDSRMRLGRCACLGSAGTRRACVADHARKAIRCRTAHRTGIRFAALGENSTRVDLEHRLLDNMGEGAETAHKTFDTEPGWSTLLAAYAGEVAKAT